MLIFFLGFRDVTLPLIVGSRGTPMLTPLIWERIQDGEMGPAAAMSIISFAIMLTVVVMMRRFVVRILKSE